MDLAITKKYSKTGICSRSCISLAKDQVTILKGNQANALFPHKRITIQRAALLVGIPSDPKVVQPLLYYIDLREKLYADSTPPQNVG